MSTPTPIQQPTPEETLNDGFDIERRIGGIRATLVRTTYKPEAGSIPWACMWLADLDKLRILGNRFSKMPNLTQEDIAQVFIRALEHAWAAATPIDNDSQSVDGDEAKAMRIAASHDLCIARDEGQCFLGKHSDFIKPTQLFNYTKTFETNELRDSFWTVLDLFWSDSRIEKWKSALGDCESTATCINLMSMGLDVHNYWKRAMFALRPVSVSDDKKTLMVQFFWIRKFNKPFVLDEKDIKPFLAADSDATLGNGKIFDCVTLKRIISGDIVSIYTEDPEKWPLPSWDLLEMMWFLYRVVAISEKQVGRGSA